MLISICEDNLSTMNEIGSYISKYLNNMSIKFYIEKYNCGGDFLRNYSKGKFDIIFLDIYLGDTLGVDIAHEIRKLDFDVIIIFITSSVDYTLDGFEVNATHYLLKPVNFNKVASALDRCQHIISKNKKQIDIISNKTKYELYVNDIIFIEIFNTMAIVHTKLTKINTYISLKKFEILLESSSFLRCHKSYLINMNYIKDIDKNSFILNTGTIIPIKQNGAKTIKDKYIDFIFNSMRKT